MSYSLKEPYIVLGLYKKWNEKRWYVLEKEFTGASAEDALEKARAEPGLVRLLCLESILGDSQEELINSELGIIECRSYTLKDIRE